MKELRSDRGRFLDAARFTRIAALIMVLLLGLPLAACKVDLNSGLSEQEANEIVALLLENGIDASKVAVDEGNVSVRIDEVNMLPAVNLLRQAGFPRQPRESLGSVFQKTGIMSSPFEERVRFIYALSQELSDTLGEIDGVLTARVHIVLPKDQEIGAAIIPSSAAVFIKHRRGIDLDFFSPQIKRLVSNAIEGVSYDKVSVVLVEAADLAEEISHTPRTGSSSFLGIDVMPADEGAIRTVILAGGGVIVALFLINIAVVLLIMRGRRRKRRSAVAAQEFEPA